jgi:hypothetical protein
MTRMLGALLVLGLVLAPAAAAKGPHAILTSGPEPVAAGAPWEATIELNEFRGTPHPLLIAMRPGGHVDAQVRKVPAGIQGAQRFRTTMLFPREGRWKLMLIAGKRRFSFPALSVGGGRAPQDYVSFPPGSMAARQGAGGVYIKPEPVDTSAGGGALSRERLSIAQDAKREEEEDGLAMWWLFPVVGVVLAGAGIALHTRG